MENWETHLTRVEQRMKGQPFWKTALFGVMCLRRQQPVYERLCVGREWGNVRGMAKVVARFYQAIPTGYAIGDAYLAIVEDSAVVPEEDWDALAVEYVQNAELLLDLFEAKDKKAVRALAERNLEFLHIYLDFEAAGYEGLHPLTEAEMSYQLRLAEELAAVENRDKRAFVRQCRERAVESILRDAWFANYPDYRPVRRKKTGPGSDGLRFRTAHQRACVANRDYLICWNADEQGFAALEAYQNSPHYALPPVEELPPELKEAPISVWQFARGHYLSFYESMCFRYQSRAEKLYLTGRPMEEVLRALHQAAECAILTIRLWRRTAEPRPERPSWGYQHTAPFLAMLIHRYDTAEELMDQRTSAYTRLLGHLFQGRREAAGEWLPACEEQADIIYRGADVRMARALCGGEAEEIRAAAVKFLRVIRAAESLYCEVFPMHLILAVRCAAQMGSPIRKMDVSELPEALIGAQNPFDPESSRPFGAEKLAELC